jgi:hypothetical protein
MRPADTVMRNTSGFAIGLHVNRERQSQASPTTWGGQPQLFFDVTAYTVLQIRSTLVPPQ